jgi:hypothetical protein
MFGPTFNFQKFTIISSEVIKLLKKIYNPLDFYLPARVKFAPPYTSPDLAQKSFK